MRCQLSFQAKWRLCLGCGICKYLDDHKNIRLIDIPSEGIRSVISSESDTNPSRSFQACPVFRKSIEIESPSNGNYGRQIEIAIGTVLEIFEGHASDAAIRNEGASGGVLTALSLFCIEQLEMHGVLHTGQNPENPTRNITRLSRNREELMAAAGSRYSPASVCDGLNLVQNALTPCVFIGRPVEVAALRNVQILKPELSSKIGVALSFFCAESPSTQGTLDLLKKMGVDPDQVEDLRYRGKGWPGYFAPRLKGQNEPIGRMPYKGSWSFLQAYRPWASTLWPDGTGELADISCGDPWYEQPDGINPGSSLVVVRTKRGQKIIQGAIAAGYLELKPAEPWKLIQSQQGLISKKQAVWGRLLVMRLFGIPVPKYPEYRLFENWLKLPFLDKLRSTLGTARRIIQRGYWRPMEIDPEKLKLW